MKLRILLFVCGILVFAYTLIWCGPSGRGNFKTPTQAVIGVLTAAVLLAASTHARHKKATAEQPSYRRYPISGVFQESDTNAEFSDEVLATMKRLAEETKAQEAEKEKHED